MKTKLPFLIIIPHGGLRVPEELSGFEVIDKFGLFIESDTCANELFGFRNEVAARVDTNISRLFVDPDRNKIPVQQCSINGVMSKETLTGKKIYKDKVFPDEIAIANIIMRYYIPFHNNIAKILKSGDIKFIIDCHTVMAVGPKASYDSGKPRPLVIVENIVKKDENIARTCSDELAAIFLEGLKKSFASEDATVAGRFSRNKPLFNGCILEKYGLGDIPMIRLSISKSLFLNDRYFSYDYLKVDELRIAELKNKILHGIESVGSRYFC